MAKSLFCACVAMLAGTAAHAAPAADETLAALFAKATRPQFVSAGAQACTVNHEPQSTDLRVAQFDGSTGDAHAVAHWELTARGAPPAKALAEIAAACGGEMRLFISLALASCRGDDAFAALLSDPATLAIASHPWPDALARLPQALHANGYFGDAPEVGCARVATSRDGRARAWTERMEKLEGAESGGAQINADLEGKPTATPRDTRGLAFFQWRDEGGAVHVYRDASGADLHLDGIVDAVEPLPGAPDRFLLLGLRAYLTTYPGARPRRFAELIVAGSTPAATLAPEGFSSGSKKMNPLLLSAPVSNGEKFRHHALARRWLQLDAATGTILLEAIPGPPGEPPLDPRPPQPLAKLKDGTFVVELPRSSELQIATGWK